MAKGAYIGVNTKIYTNSIGDLAVGSVIKINENGSPVDYIVVHQGNPDSSMYDASCDGTWVLRKDIYANTVWRGSYSNVYKSSYINSYLSSTFFNVLDSNIQSAIVEAVIPYVDGYGSSGTIRTGADGLSTKVFLLSGCEVGFSTSSYSTTLPVDGVKLDYFSSSDNTTRIAYLNGTATYWWCRTPNKAGTYNVFRVTSSGTADYNPPDVSIGVRPAFILPSTLSLTNNVVTGAEASYTTQSVARKIKGGYIGIEGKIYPNSVGLLPVGSTVKINENGSPVDYLVVHQGNPNPTMYDASCDGTWVLRKDLVVFNTMGYHYNDYGASYMHNNLLNGTFLATLDTLVQNSIVQVKIPYYNRNGIQGSLATGASGLSAQVFLLSIRELGINTTTRPSSSSPVDGTALQYFKSASDSKRIANYNGSAYVYWTRTPSIGSSGMMNCIMNTGQVTNNDFSATTIGARPAFVLPSTLLVSNGIVNGEQAELTRSGISHIIKKAYIGIGGVARPCWSGGELAYYGTITALSVGRYEHAAASTANYALFGGDGSTVDAYNATLTRSNPSALSQSRNNLAATAHNGSVLFGGGHNVENINYAKIVDRYDASLTRSTLTQLTYNATYCAATSVGEYALFAGGCDNQPQYDKFSTANAYNLSFTQSVPTALSQARYNLAATTVGEYALFAGGDNENYSNVVDTYNTALTKSTATTLQSARKYMAATAVGNYALFGGGYGIGKSDVVDAYNTSLTRTNPTVLSVGRMELAATTVGTFAVFGGGQLSYSDYSDVVDIYDASLTRTVGTTLSIKRYNLAATSIGNYALFGGGYSGRTSNVVDAYVVA